MTYPADCHIRDARENKVYPNPCQEGVPKIPKKSDRSGFGQRLIEAFGGASQRDIAKLIGVKDSTISEYMKSEAYPTAERLIKISEITKCNLHWLLTGEGDPGGPLDEMLPETERTIVRRIAEIYGLEVDRVIQDLVYEALLTRGAHALSRYTHLQEDQLEELDAIYTILRDTPLKRATRPRRV